MWTALTLAALASSAVFVGLFLRVARRRFLDRPGERSSHAAPTPTGGGIGALAAWLLVVGSALAGGFLPWSAWYGAAFASAVVLGVVGLWDDLSDLPRSVRYCVQLLVALLSVWVVGLPELGLQLPSVVVFAAAVIGFTYLVNAFNFMDGIDGLVGGTGSVILCFLAYFSCNAAWLVLAAAYLGFLAYNLPPARIFMGDAGSTALGGLVSVAIISGAGVIRVAHLLILAPLIGDSAYTLCRRLIRRENVLLAHHSHIYQRLLRAGHRHGRISAGYALMTAAIGVLVAVDDRIGGFIALFAILTALLAVELYLGRKKVPFTRPR